jgi:hypothetical protein
MNLDELAAEWDNDCVIVSDKLDNESLQTPKYHAKYLRYLMNFKIKAAALQNEYNVLRQKKFKYYRGEMSRDELNIEGWSQWQGIKPIRSEMDEWLTGDQDLNKSKIKIEYINIMIEAIESIMNQIKARDWQIKNAIAFKVFINGG